MSTPAMEDRHRSDRRCAALLWLCRPPPAVCTF
jgi:hypothetical protein